ncbi:class II histone deacetylase [Enterovirga rhinocerotis]|uniref:Acetoin utilization deacetylase AcuC-like enzyme n=1 Tax=Enterovirga rhinocerotis TaxID=1339210 RepID=A0A4R7BZM8_9HYPH|nr:class II histone deacetylase [Enterovirga rhinocerotis]TDR90225.1 acetoin utilization deacetylase AcuC-like enzyme [Enterovirga rhinocerotis]
MPTAFLWHERFAWHEAGPYPFPGMEPFPTPDTAEGKRRIRNLVDASGLLAKLVALPFGEAEDAAILRAHSPAYLDRLRAVDRTGGSLAPFAHLAAGGLSIVRLAAGAAMAAVDGVVDGTVANAYALLRPCGHHAERDAGMGFCLVNNVAVAALHAIEARGLRRVAVVDWDVHHGNGTQDIFWNDPRVLTISLHQEALFGAGSAGECGGVEWTGGSDAAGTNINVPLPPGSGEGAYRAAFERVVVPALRRFAPDLILVASGLDACSHDTLGRMILHSDSYRHLTATVMEAAAELCEGRLVLCHEGGYAPQLVPYLGLAILETLSGQRTDIVDPFKDGVKRQPGQVLQPHQEAAVSLAATAAGLHS